MNNLDNSRYKGQIRTSHVNWNLVTYIDLVQIKIYDIGKFL